MKKKITRFWLSILFTGIGLYSIQAQDNHKILNTENATASFFSEAPMENIEAINRKVSAAMNLESGELMFVVPVSGFEFEKALMQKHFNEQYLESDKFPEAKFQGSIVNWNGKPLNKTEVTVRGMLTIHGVSKEITEKAILEPEGLKIKASSTFHVSLEDYNVKIPKIVIKNIAEIVEVKIMADFKPAMK